MPARAGRLMSVTASAPGVWVASDRIFAPGSGSYLSACGPRGCAPIESTESCAPPECPASGTVHRVGRGLADVSDWPTDHDGYQRALEALRAEPELAPIQGYLRPHPEHGEHREREERERRDRERDERYHEEDVRWASRYRDGDRLELSLSADLATLADAGGSYAGGTASVAYVWLLDHHDAEEDGGGGLPTFLYGDVFGAELRVHALHRLDDGQSARWIAAVGIGPMLENRFEDSVVRMPSLMGSFVPEFGAILRPDRDVTWYAAWEVPVSLMLDHDVALDLTARFFVIDEWIELPDDAPENADDPAELMITLSAGVRLP